MNRIPALHVVRRLFGAATFAILTFTGAAVVGAETAAGPMTFTIDSAHSVVQFKVRHNMIANVLGTFGKIEGTIQYEAGKPASFQGKATIPVASVTTNNERRDNHLKSEDFFAAEQYPTITFESKKAEVVDGNQIRISGDLTMRGVTKPVVLDATILGVAPGMGGSTLMALEATGKVNRKDYNINWNKTLDSGGVVVSDEVQMIVQIEAKYSPPKPEGQS